MKASKQATLAAASVSLLAIGLSLAQEVKKSDKEDARPKMTTAEFQSRLVRDDSALPNGGQLQMSYANVVEKILPSVVTIFAYGGKETSGVPSPDEIPPQLRPFYDRFFGDGQGGGEEEEGPFGGPRGRRAPREREVPTEPSGVGSGFIISRDGYIMTNNHVVGDAAKLEAVVEINGSTKTYAAKVIGTDPQTDVAVIKIEGVDLPQATLGDSSKLRVGDVVLAAGAPMSLNRSVTQGIVSALGRSGMGIVGKATRMGKQGYEDFIQTDAAINPGNSGGPLVDSLGRVVGINTAIFSRSGMNSGIGFAIPVNMALNIVEDLIDDGQVSRGYLGIKPADVDAQTAKDWGLKEEGGALVQTVMRDSPAARAGLEVGDVITNVSGQRVENASKLPLIVSSHKPGSEIVLSVVRDGKPMELTAKLEALTEQVLAGGAPAEVAPKTGGDGVSVAEIVPGVEIQNLTPTTRKRYDIPDEVTGVIVTKVDPESELSQMRGGVQEGDVIVSVNLKPVRAVGEAKEMTRLRPRSVLVKIWRGGDMTSANLPK